MKFYSQFAEDKILSQIFNDKVHGTCIEVGANNGIDDSTSFYFEKIGWDCILVEPNPYLCQEIRQVRKAKLFEYAASNKNGMTMLHVVEGSDRSHGLSTISPNEEYLTRVKIHKFSSRPVQVATTTLDEILNKAEIKGGIDFITIDVEGHEIEALGGFSLAKWKPTVMIVEGNSSAASKATRHYLKQFGYVNFLTTGVNDWYAHQSNKQILEMGNNLYFKLIAFIQKIKILEIGLILKIKKILPY